MMVLLTAIGLTGLTPVQDLLTRATVTAFSDGHAFWLKCFRCKEFTW